MSLMYLWYHVRPHDKLPEGMRPVTLTILSPVWQGPELTLVFPDGWRQTLRGWQAAGTPGELRVFWTQAPEGGPTVCLAIGGDGGVRLEEGSGTGSLVRLPIVRPFLALATSLIPAAVIRVIGPAPPRAPLLLG